VADRIVVTGMGAVTPLGLTAEETWRAAVEGRNGVSRITSLDPSGFSAQIAGEVSGFDPQEYLGPKLARRTDRFTQFALVAAREAVAAAGLEITDANRGDIGVYVGSGIGGLPFLEQQVNVLRERGPSRVSPFVIPAIIANMASGMVSMEHRLEGPNLASVSACASGAHAIGEAAEVIRRGDAVAMVTGGAEAAISPIGLAGFCAGRALSTRNDDPEHASRPFDRERDGFVPAEGAGVLVLESYEHARSRGATMHAELVGYGASADAFHMTQPPSDGYGARRSMASALRKARLDPSAIDYVNAHGTSTPLGDVSETVAIRAVFDSYAEQVPVSSTKSMMGHLIGAAGAVELIICVLAMRDGVIPPTTNYEVPDPECDLDYVPNQARDREIRYAMSNSFGFGGQNATLILGRV
jgi:3-oxoacyl-[acyl-carrier-protein] synthase II